ncbi:hypothetical protein D9611_008906 [Ephemerocybe angulata]|uniref:FHA domain-containing protein n=1 Tax=Ephemerocybe angulata TaxID=980116 RepID=A0A8H5FCS5_9AGAR|nr:hypothetical protein D9611_008906 [Tulosesus angulatus]
MWLITGPFDGEEGAFTPKTKLLRTNTEHNLGRKGTPLIINNKKISGNHGSFHVGTFDASDPNSVPSLRFHGRKKQWRIKRGKAENHFSIGDEASLKDGDLVTVLSGGFDVKVEWRRVCCYSEDLAKDADLVAECTAIGINLVPQSSPEVTHYLTPELSATPSMAAALISSAHLVKPEWLHEVIRLAPALEATFSLPLVTKYRPVPGANLKEEWRAYGIWEPNEGRLHIFHDYRFLYVGEKARGVPLDVRQMLERGDGLVESFEVGSGVDKFRRAVSRGKAKEGKKLVLVGEERALEAAVGKEALQELVQEAKSFGLSFNSADTLVQTVLDANTTKLDSEGGTSKVLPEESSSSIEVEEKRPSPPPSPRPRRLLRRRAAASREASAAPDVTPEETSQPTAGGLRRRTVSRRNAPDDMVTGLDDPSSILDGISDLDFGVPDVDTPAPVAPVAPTPRPTRLKRRLRSTEPSRESALESTFEIGDTFVEPPLKKFKALFEASDPENLLMAAGSSQAVDSDPFGPETPAMASGMSQMDSMSMVPASQTQTQSETTQGRAGAYRANALATLAALREEEEEESVPAPATTTSPAAKAGAAVLKNLKRRLRDEDGDVEMGEEGEEGSHLVSRPPAKRRATEVDQVEKSVPPQRGTSKAPTLAPEASTSASKDKEKGKSKTKGKTGAEEKKPDKDSAFLKALASTKRGKKKEDNFDREFNDLKISKPVLDEGPEPEEEWAVLAEFGDDTGLRGNFMTILEMPVFKERNGNAGRERENANPEWQGKPNFKKFKKKDLRSERTKVDLFVVNEEMSGGSYWRDEEDQDDFKTKIAKPKLRATGKRAASAAPPNSDSDDDDEPAPKTARSRKAPSRAGSSGPSQRATSQRKASSQKSKRSTIIEEDEDDDDDGGERSQLFLPDEDDDEDINPFGSDEEDEQGSHTLRSTGSRASARKAAPAKPARKPVRRYSDEDDSDEGVFKGF